MSKKEVAPKKVKKAVTSAEQKAQEAEVKRQRAIAKDVLYPFLLKNTKSILEAKRLCYEVQTAITQSFQTLVVAEQKRLSDASTSLFPMLDITKKGDAFKVNQAFYKLLENEKLAVTDGLLRGMSQVIDSFIAEETAKRSLKTLKATFH